MHQDNAPAQSALSVKTFLAKYIIPMLDPPFYSLNLAPHAFSHFPKVKSAIKITRFDSVETVKKKKGPKEADTRRFPALLRTARDSHGVL
ncbi:hypothetical protein TNCV_3551711 [Trichonephila clavipes]|nr:hypothetical protein TNCV_3551711 [Trichonephila clavipes]